MSSLQIIIETAFEQRQQLNAGNASAELKDAIETVIAGLDQGSYRVAEKIAGVWQVHEWLKKAVLLSFKIYDNFLMSTDFNNYYDKVPLKYSTASAETMAEQQVRLVPPASIRRGAYLAKGVIMMPSFVNIGAYVDSGTLIDTWSTVGSCAQIGKNVHLSGGVGIGGVLEPLQAKPTIIEDNVFVGARSEIAEGVIVEENSVIGMGVYLGQSTKIYNRATGEITYGKVPAGSVVVAGGLPSQTGQCHLYCAIIVKQVDEKTRQKTSINELLRP